MAFNYRTEYQRYRQYYTNLKKFYQQPVAKVSFFVLLSFFTVAFFSVAAIRPTVVTISQLIRDIEDKRKINDALGTKIKALDGIQAAILGVKNDLPLIFEALPEDAALGRLMQELEYSAQQTEVILVSVRFQPVKIPDPTLLRGGQAQAVSFSVSVGGSWENVNRFLEKLARIGRVLAFKQMELLSGATVYRKQDITILANVDGEAYFAKKELITTEVKTSGK